MQQVTSLLCDIISINSLQFYPRHLHILFFILPLFVSVNYRFILFILIIFISLVGVGVGGLSLQQHLCYITVFPVLSHQYSTQYSSIPRQLDTFPRNMSLPIVTRGKTPVTIIFLCFTPFSTLFHLYHGDSSLMHDPLVIKPVLG